MKTAAMSVLFFASLSSSFAQTYTFSHFAGVPAGGQDTGHVYLADSVNHTIRKITPSVAPAAKR